MARHEFNRPPIPFPRLPSEQLPQEATPQPNTTPTTLCRPTNRGRFERREPPDQGPVPAMPVRR